MRIKRFIAPDMRTALRMVRDDQGPDAVILSNRATPEGIEVVSATDYDEALAAQALRAATPAQVATIVSMPAQATIAANVEIVSAPEAAPAPVVLAPVAAAPATAPRESLMSRARAIFKLGHDLPEADAGPTLAELTAVEPQQAPAEVPRFEAMMAAFEVPALPIAQPAPVAPANDEIQDSTCDALCDADYLIALGANDVVPQMAVESIQAAPAPQPTQTILPTLHAVSNPAADPGIVAMRGELAAMRHLMEQQLAQLSVERLRGSPARAAALDALLAYGCDPALAQDIAAGLDPRLPPDEILAPLRAALMARVPMLRSEPIDEGGVIALVGPTGAGKTTTAAKLAARFAKRHRARDVALVSIDSERTGAHEQLHALGRRLGVTVCDADGSDALGTTLDQLQDYPLVLVDTAGYGVRDRALLRQILWLRSASRVRSLLVLPANANALDLGDILRRYRPAAPEGVVLTKLDETGRPGAALSMLATHDIGIAYTTAGQQVPADIDAADADRLSLTFELPTEKRNRADSAHDFEDRHAFA
ncbi:flagellar biosynthesis protein FlhF [Lysobacter sp. 2RAF19]